MLDVLYRDTRTRVTAVAAALDDHQLRGRVPATPEWTVREVLAHVVGGAVDAVNGRVDGAGSDDWTRRHVAERRDSPVPELLAEWEHAGPLVEASLVGKRFTGPNLAADLSCHEGDLREALGLGQVERQHWEQPFLEVTMNLLRMRLRGGSGLIIIDEQGREWHCGTGEPVTVLRADGYELWRAMFSRRSRRQIAAWEWTPAATTEMVEGFGVFGPRDDDQPIPPAPPV